LFFPLIIIDTFFDFLVAFGLNMYHILLQEKPTGLVAALMGSLKPVDEKVKESQISIFKGGPAISGEEFSRVRFVGLKLTFSLFNL